MSTDLQRYANMMEHQFPRQFAFAVSDTINILARQSRDNFRERVAKQVFDVKSKYLGSVVEYQRNTSRDIIQMESEFGELNSKFGKKTTTQLGTHETGGIIKPKKGRTRLHDVTRSGRVGKNMRKPIRKAVANSKVKTIRDLKPSGGQKAKGYYPRTNAGKTIGLIAWAARTKYDGLVRIKSPSKGKFGDYKVTPRGKLTMVRNLEQSTRRVQGTDWMERSYRAPVQARAHIYGNMMNKQIAYLKKANRL